MMAKRACASSACWRPLTSPSSSEGRSLRSKPIDRYLPKIKSMKLSVVIICWNDLRVIRDCLRSIYDGTHSTDFEVITSYTGSVYDSIEFVRNHYPQFRIVENQQNLGFARGNNAGIRASRGEYVLIL